MPEFKHIMLPIDFADDCDQAAEYAAWFARQSQAQVHLVHVVANPADPIYEPQEVSYWVMVQHSEQRARVMLEEVARRCLPSEATRVTHLLAGDPYEKLMEAAGSIKPDLIVMSSHGRGGIAHLIMGSVAEKIVRHAPCPVFVVRRQKS